MPARPLAPAVSFAPSLLASRFAVTHLWLPSVIGIAVFTVLMGLGGDQWLADHLFRLEGGRWALQDAWLTRSVVHKAGKWLSTAAALMAMLLCFHHWRRGRDRTLRWALLYVVVAVALGTGLISLLKSLVPMDCPWDLLRYGGHDPFVGLQQPPDRHGRPRLLPRRPRKRGIRMDVPVLLRAAVAPRLALGRAVDRPRQRHGVRHRPTAARRPLPFA